MASNTTSGASARELDIQLVAATEMLPDLRVGANDSVWAPGGPAADAEALVEFAGRARYESFGNPNPRTADTESYVHHVMEMGHRDLLEHASATMFIRGLSYTAAREILDTPGLHVTRSSAPRTLPEALEVVVPADIKGDEQLERLFLRAVEDTNFVYNELVAGLEEALADEDNALVRTKRVQEAARAIMPQATDTPLLVTGSVAQWREFIVRCGGRLASPETRAVSIGVLELLRGRSPVLVDDLVVTRADDPSGGGEGAEYVVSQI